MGSCPKSLEKSPPWRREQANPGARRRRSSGVPGVRSFTLEERVQLNRTQVQPGQIGGMVTLGAYAYCKVDADIAPIEVGDLLTTSPTKGHAQKVVESQPSDRRDPGQGPGGIEERAREDPRAGHAPVGPTVHWARVLNRHETRRRRWHLRPPSIC